jgi:hypothetical protein
VIRCRQVVDDRLGVRAGRIRSAAVVVAGVLFVVSGCGGSGSQATGAAPRVLVGGIEGGGSDAEIIGVVRYLSEPECFVLGSVMGVDGDGEEVQIRYALVWPTGAEPLAGDVAGVDVPGFGPVRDGDELGATGGYVSQDSATGGGGVLEEIPEVDEECLSSSGELAVVERIRSSEPAGGSGA